MPIITCTILFTTSEAVTSVKWICTTSDDNNPIQPKKNNLNIIMNKNIFTIYGDRDRVFYQIPTIKHRLKQQHLNQ